MGSFGSPPTVKFSPKETVMRIKFYGRAESPAGDSIASATVKIYLAGTSTPATAYTSVSSIDAVSQVTTDEYGYYTFYINAFDYDQGQLFDLVLNRLGYATTYTFYNIQSDNIIPGTYSITEDTLVAGHVYIPKGVVLNISNGITLTFSVMPEIGLYTVFTGDGTVVFPNGCRVYIDWWGDDLATAVANIGAADATVVISDTVAVAENIVVPSNICLLFEPPGKLDIEAGYTVTIGKLSCLSIYQIFDGLGSIVLSSGSVLEVYPEWWGAVGDGVTDDTDPINTALECASDNLLLLRLGSKTYKITDTLHATPFGSTYQSCNIVGNGGGYSSSGSPTIIDASEIVAKPAINIYKGRGIRLEDFCIVGGNTNIETDINIEDLLYDADYVGAGIRDSRYSPYCGICIDGGVGSIPADGGYTGFTYGEETSGSANILINNVVIRRFVVGIMVNCENGASQGDNITVVNPNIFSCKIGIASGQGQARVLKVFGGNISYVRTVYDGLEYGAQQGSGIFFYGTQVGPAFEIYSGNSAIGSSGFYSIRGESLHRIGQSGIGIANSRYPILFSNSDIHLLNNTLYGNRCPIEFEAFSPTEFIGCSFVDDGDFSKALNLVAVSPIALKSCIITLYDRTKPFIGTLKDYGFRVTIDRCHVIDSSSYIMYNGNDAYALPARFCGHWSTHNIDTPQYRYLYKHSVAGNYYYIANITSISFSATQVSFSTTGAAKLAVGDTILWQMKTVGKSLLQHTVAGAVIASIDGADVVCDLLYDRAYYDETWADGIFVLLVKWAPGSSLTGDTNSNTTISNINNTNILKVGDWIKGTNIPADTRVTGINGTNVTINNAATGTTIGVALYYDRIHSIDSTLLY